MEKTEKPRYAITGLWKRLSPPAGASTARPERCVCSRGVRRLQAGGRARGSPRPTACGPETPTTRGDPAPSLGPTSQGSRVLTARHQGLLVSTGAGSNTGTLPTGMQARAGMFGDPRLAPLGEEGTSLPKREGRPHRDERRDPGSNPRLSGSGSRLSQARGSCLQIPRCRHAAAGSRDALTSEHNATTSQLPRRHPRPPRDIRRPPRSSQLRPYDGRAMATPPGSCHVTTTTPAPCSSAAERRGPLSLGVPREAWRAAGLCPHAAPQDLGLPKQQEAGRPHHLPYVSHGVAVEGLKHPTSAPRRREAGDGTGGDP